MESFRAFLEWAYANRSHLDQTLGTLFAAASAGLSGWHVHPFRVEPGWVSAVLLLPLVDHRIPGINRDIMVLLRGDNCQNCAAKADQIVQWVIDALKRIKDQTPFSGLAFSYSDDMRMIVLSFTNPKARGVDEVIRRLQENSTIATNKDVVIVVVYWDKTANKPAIACISKACEDMKQNNPDGYRELMEKLKNSFIQALDAAMRAYPDLPADAAWHLAFAACQGDTDCILWIAEQLNKEQNNP